MTISPTAEEALDFKNKYASMHDHRRVYLMVRDFGYMAGLEERAEQLSIPPNERNFIRPDRQEEIEAEAFIKERELSLFERDLDDLVNHKFFKWVTCSKAYQRSMEIIKRKRVDIVVSRSNIHPGDPISATVSVLHDSERHYQALQKMDFSLELSLRLSVLMSEVYWNNLLLTDGSFRKPSASLVAAARRLSHLLAKECITVPDDGRIGEFFLHLSSGKLMLANSPSTSREKQKALFLMALLAFSKLFYARDRNGDPCRPYPDLFIEMFRLLDMSLEERSVNRWLQKNYGAR